MKRATFDRKRMSLRPPAGVIALLLVAGTACAQTFQGENRLLAGSTPLERPASLTVSEAGEQIALCDPQVNRIGVVDYLGRPLWAVGDQLDLGRPLAAVFLSENELLFTHLADLLILRISRETPAVLDTVANLAVAIDPERRINQLVRSGSDWIALDEKSGEVLLFDTDWKLKKTLIPHGSGRGKVLVPTSITLLPDGRILVTDRKNYPAQSFSPTGQFLFYFGWSAPGDQRGWEAVAAAVDSRNIVWVADETNAVFRLFDAAGGEIGSVPFPHPLFRTIAMTATIDQRVLVVDDTGRALFYSLQ